MVAMKSKIVSTLCMKYKYPVMMTANSNIALLRELVVLFYADKTGVVLHSTSDKYPVGYWSDDWDMSCFEFSTGIVQLRNE